jgi:monoamine oxidase
MAMQTDQRTAALTAELEQLSPGFAENFTGKASYFEWTKDPNTMAGYSFSRPGDVTKISPILSAGIGRLHFAGEHTCPEFAGYMEGALASGDRVATQLLARDGVKR